jgi:hypothetical protein
VILSIYRKPAGNLPETSAAGFRRFPDNPSLTDHTVCIRYCFQLKKDIFLGSCAKSRMQLLLYMVPMSYSTDSEQLVLMKNSGTTKKFLITKVDCSIIIIQE